MTLLYKRFFRLIAILPFEGRDFTYLGSQLILVYCFVWTSIYWSMVTFYAINSGKVPTIEMICESVVAVGVVVRYYLLLFRRREFDHLMDEIRAIWADLEDIDHCIVRHFERKIRLIFQCFFVSCVLINVMYCASAIMFTLDPTNLNHTQFLPFKWYSENGPNLWPGFKIIFVLQVLLVQNACVLATSVDTAGPLVIMIGAGYFRALRHRLISVDDKETSDGKFDFVAFVGLHQRILSCCSRIEEITRTLFFVQLLCTVYNISLVGIKIAGTDPDRYKYLSVVILNMAQLFICQWAPQHLIEESRAISTTAYFVTNAWLRRRLGKILVLVMARSQQPVQMTAAGLVNLSLETFGSMLTSAFSFFTVLRNFNG